MGKMRLEGVERFHSVFYSDKKNLLENLLENNFLTFFD